MGTVRSVRSRARLGLVSLALLPACGGGGGGVETPDISVAFESSGGSFGEGDGPSSIQIVLHTTFPSLSSDVTVEVADSGTGSATSGADYAAFAPQTLTFVAGSLDGDSKAVTLDPLDDMLVDNPGESVRLVLQNATIATPFGNTTFTVTLTDADGATVGFATAEEQTPDESSSTQAVALELELAPLVTLEGPVDVRVSDLRTGSAVPPGDYATFAPQTVTFPAGSADGAVQAVNVQVLDDATGEGDETVELGLSQPSAACTLGGYLTNVLTIQDDDPTPLALFVGSEGASGTENLLSYDEQLALGTQTVGAGPNAGSLVRVSNGGGQPMDLGPPQIAGNHPNDFALDIESTSFESTTSALALPRAEAAAAPALLAAADGGPLALDLDRSEIARMRALPVVALHGFPLPDVGPVTLELRRRPLPVSPDARLVVDGQAVAGGLRTLLGDLQLWSGSVAGITGSRAFLAFTGGGLQGFVELPGTDGRFVEFASDGDGRVRVLDRPTLEAFGSGGLSDFCAGERFVPGRVVTQSLPGDPPAEALTLSNCRLALETDFQFFQKFNSSVLLTNYVTSLIAAVSDQYVTDVQCTLSIAYLGIHTTSDDGWTTQETSGADAADLLDEFRTAWSNNFPVAADLAHFLSGDSLGGGIAYVDVLCSQSFGFGVSGSLTGTINWLTWTGQSGGFTWDFVVVAHEIGHNFGAQHTHSYCPPLDKCYTNCTGTTVCTRGTLMSYCHVNCGGLANIDLYFHPVSANVMRINVLSSCLGDAALQPGDYVQYRVRFNPLTTTGARSATLQFTHSATNVTQPFRVQLAGTAN